MSKTIKNISGALFPTPVVLVTTIDSDDKPDIITLAWAGVVCSEPFQISIAIRPSRYSHGLLEKTPEFVVNLPGSDLVFKSDRCGTTSGRNINKFETFELTPSPSKEVKPPLIEECPINLECRVNQKLSLGAHDLFIADVLCVHADDKVCDGDGKIDYDLVTPFVYLNSEYRSVAEKIGRYGYSAKQGE